MLGAAGLGGCRADVSSPDVETPGALLGDRLKGAKLVTTRDGKVVTVELSDLHVSVVADFGPDSKFWGLSTRDGRLTAAAS